MKMSTAQSVGILVICVHMDDHIMFQCGLPVGLSGFQPNAFLAFSMCENFTLLHSFILQHGGLMT